MLQDVGGEGQTAAGIEQNISGLHTLNLLNHRSRAVGMERVVGNGLQLSQAGRRTNQRRTVCGNDNNGTGHESLQKKQESNEYVIDCRISASILATLW